MSSKISGSSSDTKATVSFNSDSDDDDSSSSSSRLSSSASSEDELDVETVTFSVPLLSQNKGKTVESARTVDRKETAVEVPKNKEQELIKDSKVGKSEAGSRSRSSPKEVEVVEAETSKKFTKTIKDDGEELKVAKTSTTNTERAKSPKITVNDVEAAKAENDVTGNEKTSTRTRGNSPKKIAIDESKEGSPYLASTVNGLSPSRREKSPQNSGPEEEIESTKPAKKTSKVISTVDSDEKSSVVSKPRKSTEDSERSKSKSFKIASEETEVERANSPKKISEEKEISRAKSPRLPSEGKDALGEKSLRSLTKETSGVEEARKKSSRDPAKALDDLIRSTESPEKSPARNTKSRLQANQDTEDAEDATAKIKKPKKSKSPKQDDGDVRDDELTQPAADKTGVETGPKYSDKGTLKGAAKDSVQGKDLAEGVKTDEKSISSKDGPSSGRTAIETGSGRTEVDEDTAVLGGTRKTKGSELSGSEETSLTTSGTGRTDGATSAEEKTSKKTENGSENPGPSLGGSKYLRTDEEGTKELLNEDSEFTYRRKSMDEFIKRILAEAREEKLKQKEGLKGETPGEGARKTEGYGEHNGDIATKEILGRPPKWSCNSTADREASNLDKRLASIEKRRSGGTDSAKDGSSKVKVEEEATKKKPLQNDVNDFDVNLDDDLEEINRFLQSRKSASARFEYEDGDLENDSTTGKRRWLTDNEPPAQPEVVNADDGIPSPGTKIQARKKFSVDLDDEDDDDRFLARFKRERDPLLPEMLFAPRRRDETDEIVRERTRSVKVLVDQQLEIVQSMRNTSKNLDELEKEIREVRQVSLDRQARIEALEGALSAEYRAYQNDQLAASDRQRSTEMLLKDDLGRPRRPGKLNGDVLEEELYPFRRRSGSVTSVGSYGSAFGIGRSSDAGSDLSDLRPSSALRQQRSSDLRRTENESEYQDIDRRRGGSVNRDRGLDVNPFGPDDAGLLLSQRSARSRASIATSSPALDFPGTASGDSFLAKIRAKYSFLAAPSVDTSGYLGSTRSQGLSNYGATSLLSSSDFKYGRPRSTFEDARSRTKDFLTSSISPSSYGSMATGSYTPGYYSVRDSKSPSYGGFGGGGGGGTSDRTRRAQSVTEFSFDRPTAASAHPGSAASTPAATSAGGGGEFHSRFLDKVRGKKAMGEDVDAPKGQDKPFRSRFLKNSSFESSSSRSGRVTEDGAKDKAVDSSEVAEDA